MMEADYSLNSLILFAQAYIACDMMLNVNDRHTLGDCTDQMRPFEG